MSKVITDLEAIAKISKRNEDRNYAFRTFIKCLDWSDRKLDTLVHEILRSVESQIDCTKCANCCRVLGAALLPDDSKRLAERLGLPVQEFEEKYAKKDELGDTHIVEMPCPFLEECKCSVYEDRPTDCREYPHIQKPGFRGRMFSVLDNAEVCPIVFNVLEQLKEYFHH